MTGGGYGYGYDYGYGYGRHLVVRRKVVRLFLLRLEKPTVNRARQLPASISIPIPISMPARTLLLSRRAIATEAIGWVFWTREDVDRESWLCIL